MNDPNILEVNSSSLSLFAFLSRKILKPKTLTNNNTLTEIMFVTNQQRNDPCHGFHPIFGACLYNRLGCNLFCWDLVLDWTILYAYICYIWVFFLISSLDRSSASLSSLGTVELIANLDFSLSSTSISDRYLFHRYAS